MVRELYLTHCKESEVSAGDSDISFVKYSESILDSEPVNSTKNNAMLLLTLSMILKDTVSPDGSSTEFVTIKKARIFKWPLTSSKPNSERISKDYIKSKPTEVSDTSGVSESEVNTLKQPAVVVQLWVYKEKRND